MDVALSSFHLSASSELVYQNYGIQVSVPSEQLAYGSLKIETQNPKIFEHWTPSDHRASFRVMKQIADAWQKPYLIYGHQNTKLNNDVFNWEIVPYEPENNAMIQQLSVLWNVVFGGSPSEITTQKSNAKKLFETFENTVVKANDLVVVNQTCPFCNDVIIQNQQVWEGKNIRVLYNYNPVTYYHFLIIPKKHRPSLDDLAEEEYCEMLATAQEVVNMLSKGFNLAHIYTYSKNRGPVSGQTVPHCHLHIVGTEDEVDDWFSKGKLFWNMTGLGAGPLDANELGKRVTQFKALLEK